MDFLNITSKTKNNYQLFEINISSKNDNTHLVYGGLFKIVVTDDNYKDMITDFYNPYSNYVFTYITNAMIFNKFYVIFYFSLLVVGSVRLDLNSINLKLNEEIILKNKNDFNNLPINLQFIIYHYLKKYKYIDYDIPRLSIENSFIFEDWFDNYYNKIDKLVKEYQLIYGNNFEEILLKDVRKNIFGLKGDE